jgi:tetratricopeptide (TPR) repeat protein
MARVHHILGRLPDAERFYRRAIEVRPDSALAWAGLGRVLASQQRLKAGLEAIERAIGLDQNLLEACHTRARIWSAMRRHAEAAEEYGRCVELAAAQETPLPERVDLLRAQARALTYAGQAEAARQAWRRLLDLAPQDPEAKKALEP